MKRLPVLLNPSPLSVDQKKGILLRAADELDKGTGVPLTVTSFIRDSPGHVGGDSLDVAPSFTSREFASRYSVSRRSDPVLHLRAGYVNDLVVACLERRRWLGPFAVLVALENDHLHIQVGLPGDPRDAGRFIFFPFPKDLSYRYPDSLQRQQTFLKPPIG